MSWSNIDFIGPKVGQLRGFMENGTALGESHEGVLANFLTVASNVVLTSGGGVRRRPGRATVTGYTGRTSPAWVGTAGGFLYDSDGTLRKGATSVQTGMVAAATASAVYTNASGTTYLLVVDGAGIAKKIANTTSTDMTGQPLSAPTGVAVFGTKVALSQANEVVWTSNNPLLTSAGEWTGRSFAFAAEGLEDIQLLLEFGGPLYAFGKGAIGYLDHRDPTIAEVALSGYGVSGRRAAVVGNDRIFFTNSRDVWEWVPGGMPRSIASLDDGRSLVRGVLQDVAATDPYDVMGYDKERDILTLSNDNNTLFYQVKNEAWTQQGFGSDCWCYYPVGNTDPGLYYTETGLTETLYMDWDTNADVLAGVTTPFTLSVQTAHKATGEDSMVKLKTLKFGFPLDATLSDTTVNIEIIENGQGFQASGVVAMTQNNIFTLDSSLLDGGDVLGGSGGTAFNKVGFPYPEAFLLGVRLSVTENSPFMLYSLSGQVKAVFRNAGP